MEGDVGANTDNSDTDIMTPTRNRTNRGMAGLVLTYLDDALNDIRIPSQARWMYQPWLMNGFICFMVEAIAGLGDYYDRNQGIYIYIYIYEEFWWNYLSPKTEII